MTPCCIDRRCVGCLSKTSWASNTAKKQQATGAPTETGQMSSTELVWLTDNCVELDRFDSDSRAYFVFATSDSHDSDHTLRTSILTRKRDGPKITTALDADLPLKLASACTLKLSSARAQALVWKATSFQIKIAWLKHCL